MTEERQKKGVTPSIKSTNAAAEVKFWRNWYYDHLNNPKKYGDFASLGMYGTPQEILRAFGIWEGYCENYGPVCAAKQVSDHFCEVAEGEGYSMDLCSYMRVGLGYVIRLKQVGNTPPEAPYGGMGKPEMIISITGACDGRCKYPQAAARYLNVPYFCMDMEDLHWTIAENKEIKKRYVEHYYEQLKEFICFLERVTGKKYNSDRLSEALEYWMKAHELFHDACELKKCHPNPLPSQDNFAVCFPHLVMKGTKECADYYQRLYDEIKFRADNKIGSIPDEKYRIFWWGLPPWFHLGVYNYLEEHEVATLDCTYDPGDVPEVDLNDDPLWSIARKAYEGVWFANGLFLRDHPTRRLVRFIKEYEIDGVITMLASSCRQQVGNLFALKLLEREVDIPILRLEAVDMTDVRTYSDTDIKSRIDTFLEMVDKIKGRGS